MGFQGWPGLSLEMFAHHQPRLPTLGAAPIKEVITPREKAQDTMAKVTLNPVLEAIRGRVGDLVFRRWDDQVIVGKMPDRTGIVPSANQIAQQDQFRLAVLYGKAVLADEEQRTIYEDAAARKGQPVFALTVGDFLNAPVVAEVDMAAYAGQIGDKIACGSPTTSRSRAWPWSFASRVAKCSSRGRRSSRRPRRAGSTPRPPR